MKKLSANIQRQKLLLDEIVDDWRKRLTKALIRVENRIRAEKNLPQFSEDSEVYLPCGPNARLYLLTLKVWALRYSVSPEFILDHVLEIYRRNRRLKPFMTSELTLGLSAHLVSGAAARESLSELVSKTYSNDENLKVLRQPVLPNIRFIVNENNTLDQILARYGKAIEQAQKKYETQTRRMTQVSAERSYRRSIREDIL